MIIPVKCFTCGHVLGNKYQYYLRRVREMKLQNGDKLDKVMYLTTEQTQKTPEGVVLDELNLKKMCCRRHILSHVEIE